MTPLRVSYVQNGISHEVDVDVPDSGDSDASRRVEAAHFVQTLADNGQLDGPGATHRIVPGPNGTKVLRRRGFAGR